MDISPIEVIPPDPPWADPSVKIELDLIINANKSMSNNILKELAKITISQNYKDHLEIYTDGSRCKFQNS